VASLPGKPETPVTNPSPETLTSDTAPVAERHRFDRAALERYMAGHVEGFRGPLEVAQCRGGMSNPTYVVSDGVGARYVLRKKPPGTLLPSAHAVEREYRIITALAGTGIPVARTYALCEDPSVIGQAFYVMEFMDGRVFRELTLPGLAPAERGAIYDAMNGALAALHSVDYGAVGLGDYGRAGGYVGRQVSRWSKQYRASRTDDLEAIERLMAWLPENLPEDTETTIAHGDFRLENMIFHASEPRILAIVDWELSTLGSPLSDLAYNCLPYHMPDARRGDLMGLDHAVYGIPSEADYVAAYCARTGRAGIEDWNFFIVLSLFRLAAIVQGVYFRGLKGNAPSPEALARRDTCRELSEIAWGKVKKGA
jgi:aminoglycoside phosphotransferase (APT) family kinase protein